MARNNNNSRWSQARMRACARALARYTNAHTARLDNDGVIRWRCPVSGGEGSLDRDLIYCGRLALCLNATPTAIAAVVAELIADGR